MNTLGSLKLVQRGPTFYVHGTFEGKRIRRSTSAQDIGAARIAMEDIYAELCSGWKPEAEGGDTSWPEVAKWIRDRHKVSAKERGIPFDLSTAEIYGMMRTTEFRCAVSGIAFSRKAGPNAAPDPWSASLDRIEPRHGYTKENIRVVCLIANLGMNRWGYDALLRLSRAVVRNATAVVNEEKLTQCVSAKGQLANDFN